MFVVLIFFRRMTPGPSKKVPALAAQSAAESANVVALNIWIKMAKLAFLNKKNCYPYWMKLALMARMFKIGIYHVKVDVLLYSGKF